MAKKPVDPHTTPHPTLAGRAMSGRLMKGPAPTIAALVNKPRPMPMIGPGMPPLPKPPPKMMVAAKAVAPKTPPVKYPGVPNIIRTKPVAPKPKSKGAQRGK